MNTDELMYSCGWSKAVHTILGKDFVRFHKEGFEMPLEFLEEIIDKVSFEADLKQLGVRE